MIIVKNVLRCAGIVQKNVASYFPDKTFNYGKVYQLLHIGQKEKSSKSYETPLYFKKASLQGEPE
jgi:hypothetical protein